MRTVVIASGTSFYWGMRLLPAAKRKAMYAIYAFCREVDDVADGDAPVAAKLDELAGWRREIDALFAGRPEPADHARPARSGRAVRSAGRRVPRHDRRHGDGRRRQHACALDERADALLPLRRRRGGAPVDPRVRRARRGGARGALALGEALQLTNILRDLDEDATRGRLYLPRELLEQHRIIATDPISALRDPGLPEVCDALAARPGRALPMPSVISGTAIGGRCGRRWS